MAIPVGIRLPSLSLRLEKLYVSGTGTGQINRFSFFFGGGDLCDYETP